MRLHLGDLVMMAAALALALALPLAVDDTANAQALVTAAVASAGKDGAVQQAAGAAPPIVFAQAPIEDTPPPTTEAPPPAMDASPPTTDPAPPADPSAPPTTTLAPDGTASKTEPPGMNPIVTAVVQVATGCGTMFVCSACSGVCALIPYVGSCVGLVSIVAAPVLVGSLGTLVADTLGQKRGALLWPVAASCGGACVGMGLNLIAGIVTYALGAATFLAFVAAAQQNPGAAPAVLLALGPIALIPLAAAVVYATLVTVPPAVAYALTAEDKKPGDTGQFTMPGLAAPNHPTAAPAPAQASRRAPANAYAQAMAF